MAIGIKTFLMAAWPEYIVPGYPDTKFNMVVHDWVAIGILVTDGNWAVSVHTLVTHQGSWVHTPQCPRECWKLGLGTQIASHQKQFFQVWHTEVFTDYRQAPFVTRRPMVKQLWTTICHVLFQGYPGICHGEVQCTRVQKCPVPLSIQIVLQNLLCL